MNRENYDKTFISTADIISAYFTDIFYNDLYLKARERVKAGSSNSITDAYKSNIVAYMYGINDRNMYMKVILNLHEYYRVKTAFNSIIFSDFEDRILTQFIPMEYFHDFTSDDKDTTLFAITKNTVQTACDKVLSASQLRLIIDQRNQSGVIMLQNEIVGALMLMREEYHASFARKLGQKPQSVSVEVMQKLKKALVEETKRRCKAEQDRDKAIGIVYQLMEKIKTLQVCTTSVANDARPPLRPSPMVLEPPKEAAEAVPLVPNSNNTIAIKNDGNITASEPTATDDSLIDFSFSLNDDIGFG